MSAVSIRSYNHPEAGMSPVGLLVESLVVRNRVLGVDETASASVKIVV